MQLSMNDKDWHFVEGAWSQDADGIISAPADLGDRNAAINTTSAYLDVEAEFEFRWDIVWTGAGFVFRAKDSLHYYMVHFPAVGQQYRAEHFWACISKVDGTGLVDVLKMEMVHGVSSAARLWHKVKVNVAGDVIRVWVDGRPVSPVMDDTYPDPGYLGLSTYSSLSVGDRSRFRNLQINGQAVEAQPFDPEPQPQQNWFQVTDAGGTGCGPIVRAPNGDLLVALWESGMFRSKDNGLTFGGPYPLPDKAGHDCDLLFTTHDGELTILMLQGRRPFQIRRMISHDSGETWSQPSTVGEITLPADDGYTRAQLTRVLGLKDGSVLMFVAAGGDEPMELVDGRRHHVIPIPGRTGLCLRSTDGGRSWSDPVNVDGLPRDDDLWQLAKPAGNETSAAETAQGNIIALVRPLFSPVMWETWSQDGGRSWTPAARGAFPMYGCNNSMISTASGALVIGGRFPGIAVQVSRDDGMTWQCTMIDNTLWANGAMFEVEPNVVLYIYGGKNDPREMRGQLLRITDDGIEPVRAQ